MTEQQNKIALVHQENHWSRECLQALNSHNFPAYLVEPDVSALPPSEVANRLHIVSVSGPKPEDLLLVDHIYRHQGRALVLASARSFEVIWACFYKYNALGIQKSADFNRLVEVLEELKSIN